MLHLARLSFLVAVSACGAELSLAPVFTSHMVVQRDVSLPIWGRAEPGAAVVGEFAGEQQRATADAAGRWRLQFAPCPASAEPKTMRFSCAGATREIGDVLVGEVWLCAGQSNMEWPLAKEAHATEEIPRASHPEIRLLNPDYAGRTSAGNPFTAAEIARLTPEHFYHGAWEDCTPEAAARFSAIGYYFAREVQAKLAVPVGVINLAVGGSPAEAWMPLETLASDPGLRALSAGEWLSNPALEAWCLQRARENLGRALASGEIDPHAPNHAFRPGFLWSAAIVPLAPFALRGVLWYQGESNSLRADRVRQHEMMLPLLVRDWRARWGLGDFPFLYCQLSGIETTNYHSEFWPDFRDSQRRLLDVIPQSGMVVTSDVGDPESVHPRDKRTVAIRLARLALNATGGAKAAPGPLPLTARLHGHDLVVEFTPTDTDLRTADGQPPREFELAGADGVFHEARVRLSHAAAVLSHELVPAPWAARYAWRPFSHGNIVGAGGLPVTTFLIRVAADGR